MKMLQVSLYNTIYNTPRRQKKLRFSRLLFPGKQYYKINTSCIGKLWPYKHHIGKLLEILYRHIVIFVLFDPPKNPLLMVIFQEKDAPPSCDDEIYVQPLSPKYIATILGKYLKKIYCKDWQKLCSNA